MLKEFLSWWAQQMLGLIPRRLSALGEDWETALIVTPLAPPESVPPVVELCHRKGQRESRLESFTLDRAGIEAARREFTVRRRPARVVLRLPAAMLLERALALPLAAEREPERVLHYEMDRLTPFRADEVFWSWAIERRDRPRGRLHLRLSLVPKAGLAPLLAALEEIGISPGVLEAPAPAGQRRLIAVSRAESHSDLWRRRRLAAAGALCGTLAFAAVALPFVQQSFELQSIEKRIEALRPRVSEVEALRRKLASDNERADVLAADQARLGDALQAIAEVTDVLPDDTYLTEFSLHERKLTLSGRSHTAAKLIAVLSADPLIRNPAFAAPVTRAEGSNTDLFSIRAELGQ